MSNFLIRVDDGTEYRNGGPADHLGAPFTPAHQTPVSYEEDGWFLVVTHDGGAKRRIPQRRVIDILEG